MLILALYPNLLNVSLVQKECAKNVEDGYDENDSLDTKC